MWVCINGFRFKKSPQNDTSALIFKIQAQYLLKLNISTCPRTSSNISPRYFTRWHSSYGLISAGEWNHTLKRLLLAYVLNWINEEAPDCVTATKRQEWMESGIHQGLLVDLISLCLPPCVMPENLMHSHMHAGIFAHAHPHTNSCKRDKLWMPPVDQRIGMATQLGGNARKKTASERKKCTILVSCLCQGKQERKWVRERRGWCEVCWSLSSGMLCWDQV